MVLPANSETEMRRSVWSEVIAAEYSSAVNFTRWRLGNSDFDKEIVSEAATKLLRLSPDHRSIEDRRNYWLKIVSNQINDHLRKQRRAAAMFIPIDTPLRQDDEGDEQSLELPDPGPNPEEIAQMKQEAEELRARFESRCGKLTEREITLLMLHLQELTNDQIASALGEDVKVIRMEWNALKTKLRYRLQKPQTNA